MDEEVGGTYTDSSIQSSAGEKAYGSDSDKISYIAPSMGPLTVGASYMDGGVAGDTDATAIGGKLAIGDNISIGATMAEQGVSGAIDNESHSVGAKIALGNFALRAAYSCKMVFQVSGSPPGAA